MVFYLSCVTFIASMRNYVNSLIVSVSLQNKLFKKTGFIKKLFNSNGDNSFVIIKCFRCISFENLTHHLPREEVALSVRFFAAAFPAMLIFFFYCWTRQHIAWFGDGKARYLDNKVLLLYRLNDNGIFHVYLYTHSHIQRRMYAGTY